MDDHSKDNWAELQKNLGVEKDSLDHPDPLSQQPSGIRGFDPDNMAEPTRPDSGWDSLLGDFGIDTPVQPMSEPETPTPEVPTHDPSPAADSELPSEPPTRASEQKSFGGFGAGLIDQDELQDSSDSAPRRESTDSIGWGDSFGSQRRDEEANTAEQNAPVTDTNFDSADDEGASSSDGDEAKEDRPPKRRRSRRRGRGRGRDRAHEASENAERVVSADDDTDVERPEDADLEEPTQVESAAASQPESTSLPEPAFGEKSGFTMKPQLSLPDWFPFAGRRSKTPPAGLEQEQSSSTPSSEEAETREKDAAFNELADSPFSKEDTAEQDEAGDGENREDRPRRRRRRRGRRRGRGGDQSTEATVSADDETLLDETVEDTAEESDERADGSDGPDGRDSDSGRSRGRRRRRRRQRSPEGERAESSNGPGSEDRKEDPSWSSDRDDDSDSDAPSSSKRGRRSSSRQIPSWSETIAYVVDANIAAKDERRKASANSSRGGSGRGRSRGGRRRRSS